MTRQCSNCAHWKEALQKPHINNGSRYALNPYFGCRLTKANSDGHLYGTYWVQADNYFKNCHISINDLINILDSIPD